MIDAVTPSIFLSVFIYLIGTIILSFLELCVPVQRLLCLEISSFNC